MNSCRVDASSSPTFRSQLSPFLKKHRKFKKDWEAAVSEISLDYKNACDAARVPNRQFPAFILEVWKYSIACSDLKRNAKKGFRSIAVFLDPEVAGLERILYFVLFYFKGDQPDFSHQELQSAVAYLRGQLDKVAAAGETAMEPPDV